jgi:hypothetical protein
MRFASHSQKRRVSLRPLSLCVSLRHDPHRNPNLKATRFLTRHRSLLRSRALNRFVSSPHPLLSRRPFRPTHCWISTRWNLYSLHRSTRQNLSRSLK